MWEEWGAVEAVELKVYASRAMRRRALAKGKDRIVYMDSGANKSVFGNKELLRDVREAPHRYMVRTAQGVVPVTLVGDLPGWGEVLYLPGSPNLIAMCHAEDMFEVKYEQGKNFEVIDEEWSVKFESDDDKLYSRQWEVVDKFVSVNSFVDTVRERAARYSPADQKGAELSRDTIRMMAFPGDGGLAYNIQHGAAINNPITMRNLRVAADVYGRDVGGMKGKEPLPVAVQQSLLEVEKAVEKRQ